MEDKIKPAILIALAKKGKAQHAPESDDGEDGASHDEHLQSIADDIMDAIHSKDSSALKDLLVEMFEACDAAPHIEGPHEDEGGES